jgi:HK97 gp10 family phage protein
VSSIEDPLHPLGYGVGLMRANVTREVEGLEQMALQLVAMEVVWHEEMKRSLKAAAQIIKTDARAQIGHYQPEAGEYPEWAPLAESTEDEKARLGAPADAPLERFGDLKKSFRSTMVGDKEVIVGSTDPNMDWHEFGTSKMPPRPVLGPALLKNIEKIRHLLGHAMLDTVVSGQRLGYRFNASEMGTPHEGNADWHFSEEEKGEQFG